MFTLKIDWYGLFPDCSLIVSIFIRLQDVLFGIITVQSTPTGWEIITCSTSSLPLLQYSLIYFPLHSIQKLLTCIVMYGE